MSARGKLAVLVLGAVAAGCLPSRDNPSDPTNLEPPEIRITDVRAFTCRQWLFPLVPGHDELEDSPTISRQEREEIDAFCDATCPSSDPGGPPADPAQPWTPNACHNTMIYAGSIGLEDDLSARCEAPRVKAVQEQTARTDAPPTVDLVVYARVNGSVDVPVLATTDADADELRKVAIPRKEDESAVDAGYPGIATLMTREFRQIHSEGVLLTRVIDDVDRFSIDVVLSATKAAQAVEQRADCMLTFRFEQSVESFQHPLGLAGGYGRSVSLGDLDLEKDGPSISNGQLEIATSYRVVPGSCYADLVYRDAATRAHHWGQDGHAPIAVPCRADGEPPDVLIGRFRQANDDALAVPVFDGAVHRIEYWSVGSAFTIVPHPGGEFGGSGAVAPESLVDVGDLDGDGLSEIAVVSADRSSVSICSAAAVACAPLAVTTCDGEPAQRIAAVAASPHGVAVPALALLAQSSDETCLQRWTGFLPGPPSMTETVFPTRPNVVALHWSVEPGGPIPVIAGAVSIYPELVVTDVDPQSSLPRSYPVVTDTPGGCAVPLAGTDNGVGVAAGMAPSLLCGASGCEYRPNRLVGLPSFDVSGQGGVIPDGGALAAWEGDACTSGAYVVQRLETPGLLPTGYGASISARPDLRRARHEQATAGSRCVVPPVIAAGAPGGGATGGAGHVIVLYPTGAPLEHPSCTDVAWP